MSIFFQQIIEKQQGNELSWSWILFQFSDLRNVQYLVNSVAEYCAPVLLERRSMKSNDENNNGNHKIISSEMASQSVLHLSVWYKMANNTG